MAHHNGIRPYVIRIVPRNERAILAFSELVDRKNASQLSDHHAQYLVTDGKSPLSKRLVLQHRSDNETTEAEPSEDESNKEVNLGSFHIGFDRPAFTVGGKWALGKGSSRNKHLAHRNVDLLLAASKSKYTRDLLAIHAFLSLHLQSGVWMIHAGSGSSDVVKDENGLLTALEKATVTVNHKQLLGERFKCLLDSYTNLRIQGLAFSVWTGSAPKKRSRIILPYGTIRYAYKTCSPRGPR